jgi:hypothetical protein
MDDVFVAALFFVCFGKSGALVPRTVTGHENICVKPQFGMSHFFGPASGSVQQELTVAFSLVIGINGDAFDKQMIFLLHEDQTGSKG